MRQRFQARWAMAHNRSALIARIMGNLFYSSSLLHQCVSREARFSSAVCRWPLALLVESCPVSYCFLLVKSVTVATSEVDVAVSSVL